MSETTDVTDVTPTEVKEKQLPTSNAIGLARKLGLEKSMRAVTTARKYAEAGDAAQRFSRDEVELLISIGQSRVVIDDLAAAVKKLVAQALGA